MRLYLAAWRTLVAVLVACGVLMACVTIRGSLLAPFLVHMAVLGLILPAARQRRRAMLQHAPLQQLAPLRQALRSAALVMLGGLAMLGFVASLGLATTIALAALLAAGSPPALEHHQNARQQPPQQKQQKQQKSLSPPQPAAPCPDAATEGTGQVAPQEMTLHELCRAWRSSYPRLQQTSSIEGRAQLVDARQQYLDEMERRDPVAFGLWLQAGARAASDPSKYLTGGRPA